MRRLEYGAKLLICVAAWMLVGCGANLYTTTYTALNLAEQMDAQAQAQFPALDKQKRADIVAGATSLADGQAKLAAWDATSTKVAAAIAGTDASVKLARDAMTSIAAGTKPSSELATWIASAVNLGLDLKNLLTSVGVPLKGL